MFDYMDATVNVTQRTNATASNSEEFDAFNLNVIYNSHETTSAANNNNSVLLTMSYPVFDARAQIVVVLYTCVFIVASVGNLTVFISLFRPPRRKSRISLLFIHLAIADLIVTFVMIPLEIFWRVTVQWIAGNIACKIFLYLRAFGLYLSSNVLVCISVDRYFAILHPLKVTNGRSRSKFMLLSAWIASFVYAIPQSFIFHTAVHPQFPNFTQCVSFGFFSSQGLETLYNFMCVLCMYFVPLSVIAITYPAILWEIHKKAAEKNQGGNSKKARLRRSDDKTIERAKIRTLRMTITIVVVFVVCWTPYVVMTLWYMFGRDSAERIPAWIQDGLFMMATSNSCMNPIVYGSYAIDCRRLCCIKALRKTDANPRRLTPHILNSHSNNELVANKANKMNSIPLKSRQTEISSGRRQNKESPALHRLHSNGDVHASHVAVANGKDHRRTGDDISHSESSPTSITNQQFRMSSSSNFLLPCAKRESLLSSYA